MKILEINKFYHVRGGADKHFLDLAGLLEKNGHEVAVFAMHHPENLKTPWSEYFVSRVDYENGNVINKIKSFGRIFWSFEAKRKIGRLLDEFKPDIVHIHNIYHQISPSVLSEIKKRQIPIVMTVHDWKLICPNYLLNCGEPFCQKCIAGKYWHCLKNKCVKNSYLKSLICVLELYFHRWLNIYEKNIDAFIVPSEFVKNILVQADFPEDKINVLPHFTRAVNARNQQDEKNNGYALYPGRVSKEKGVDELIEIFKDLPANLILAGNKDQDFVIPQLPNIKYVGFRPENEIEKLIQGSRFVVSASRLPETFGLIAMEAVKNGKYFVGYKTGAFEEIIENGRNGFLAESREEFKQNISAMFTRNHPQFDFDAQRYSSEAYHEKLVDICSRLCYPTSSI